MLLRSKYTGKEEIDNHKTGFECEINNANEIRFNIMHGKHECHADEPY